MEPILIVPGLRNSGPSHWQTWFESQLPQARRVEQLDWHDPFLPEWAEKVRQAIDAAGEPVWIVAHSFGCLATVHAARSRGAKIRGALLVAPADPKKFGIPLFWTSHPLEFSSLVVASETDPWLSLEGAQGLAQAWGSRLVNLGRAGHINVDSGYGPWPEGLELLAELQQQAPTALPQPDRCAGLR